jgi:hypothetical protein
MTADSSSDEDDFAREIAPFLAAGMPARHGLSPEAYTARCRALWDACKTDERCKYKLLIDRLYVDTRALRDVDATAGYVDPRARAAHDVSEEPRDPIYCIAMGTVPFSSILTGDDTGSGAVADVHDPSTEPEYGLWILAVLDVLGFERMYRQMGPHRLQALYDRLIAAARTYTDTMALAMHEMGDGSVPTLFSFELGFAYFSDTILLWAPLGETHVAPFLARCTDVFLEALSLGVPLRGAIAVGEAILHQPSGIFLGTPLIDAARLEHAQDWLGIALTGGCSAILQWLDSSLVMPYTPPCKNGTKPDLHSGLVLDWPRRARAKRFDIQAAIDAMHPPETHRAYYDYASAFADHSEKHARWNRDAHIPISIGFLTRALIRARLDETAAPPEVLGMLDSMGLNGPQQEAIASALRGLLNGAALPESIATLPEGPREHLRHIAAVIDDGYIDVEEIAFAVLEQRIGVAPLTARHEDYLAAEPSESNGPWLQCVPFLRALADGAPVPDLPPTLPEAAVRILSSIRDGALGQTVPIDLEALISAVLWTATTEGALSELNERRLSALERGGPPWDGIAPFLRAIAAGRDPDVELTAFDEGAISTVRVVRQVLAWQQAVRRSAVQALEAIEDVDVPFLHELSARVIDVVQGEPDTEVEPLLARLQRSGSPHDAVARWLRRLIADRRSQDIPGGLAADVTQYLQLVTAFALQEQREVSPVLYLMFAALQARIEARSLTLYEIVMLSLLATNSDALAALAQHLVAFVDGADLDPVPAALPESFRELLVKMYADAKRAAEKPTLRRTIELVLQGRAQGQTSDALPVLHTMQASGGTDAVLAGFLLALMEGSIVPTIPDELDDSERQTLFDAGVRALCAPLTLSDLTTAALEKRHYDEPLTDAVRAALEALAASGAPFSLVAGFLTELVQRQLWPRIPSGIPRRTLTLLASTRQYASEFARRVIAVARKQDTPNPQREANPPAQAGHGHESATRRIN